MKRLLVLLSVALAAQAAGSLKEEPVGLVLSAAGGKVLRANTETPLAARSGDILFSGDEIRAEGGPASFLFCPDKTSKTLDAGGAALLDSKQLKLRTGKVSAAKPVNSCFLPQLVRVAVASQQHYGVSMTRGLAKPEGDITAIASLDAAVRTQIEPLEAALRANPNDTSSLIGEAAIYERNKLEANALAAYRKAATQWADAVWVRGRIFDLEESLAAQAAIKAAEISPDARTFAVLVGVSKYQKLPQDLWLQYADADAKTFSDHLASPRGGAVPANQMAVLTNEGATTAAIRNAFQTVLKNRAGKKDTVFILIAGHGTVDSRGAYILTYDSDPQDLSATAIPMAEIQALVGSELSNVGRVVLLADVCRAATIGSLKTESLGSAVEKLGEAQGELLGLMAARPKELSIEGPQYGGGHGAFSYSVTKGLQGQADSDDNHFVDSNELIEFVRTNVSKLTQNKQHPRDFGNMANATKLSDVSKSGIQLAREKTFYDSRTGEPLLLAQAAGNAPVSAATQADLDAFHAAVTAKRLLPTDTNSAWTPLSRLRTTLGPQFLFLEENNLRVALENEAQQVLLRYLAGDQNPQTKADFENGMRYMQAAMQLTPESLYLEGRSNFFSGRALLFDKQYAQSAGQLEQSIRIDPGEAYGYNALGIAYLDQAQYAKAIPAFRDAAKRAGNWSYPLHNLAVAYQEIGDNSGAIRSYQLAMKLTPQYGYLPYNLGLIYQRTNRRKDAEASYRKAMALSPESGEPLNALGTLKKDEGKTAEAEKFYRDALAKNAGLLAARHNLALLLEKDRQPEAIDAYRENLRTNPDYLASRLSLAELLTRRGDTTAAIVEYRVIVQSKPEYIAARLALSSLLIKAAQPEAALEQLRASTTLDPDNAIVWENIGDVERSLNHTAQAREAYAQALKLTTEKASQKGLRVKMAF